MQRLFTLLMLLLFASPGLRLPAQQNLAGVAIRAPTGGQALQGSVTITGSAAAEGFQSAELSFAYANDPTHTWFLIAEIKEPLLDSTLAQWDTTTLSDGDYTLRLVVTLIDGRQVTALAEGLRVRNYSPIETDTPTPLPPTLTPIPSSTLAPTATSTPTDTPIPTATSIPPTPTLLPTNPARLSAQQVTGSLAQGALSAVILFACLFLLQAIRSWFKHAR